MEEQKPACLFPCLSHLFLNAQARHAVHLVRKGQMGQGDGSSPSNPQVAQTVQFGELALLCANYLALSTTPAGQRNSPGSQGSLCGLPALTDPASLKPQQLESGEHQELTNWEHQGREAMLIATDQADVRSTHDYSALHCSLDSVLLPFLSTQFALESV